VWQTIPDDRRSTAECTKGERHPMAIEVEMILPVTPELKLVRQVVWLACCQSLERQ